MKKKKKKCVFPGSGSYPKLIGPPGDEFFCLPPKMTPLFPGIRGNRGNVEEKLKKGCFPNIFGFQVSEEIRILDTQFNPSI